MVKTCSFTARAQVQSLVRKLKSCKPWGMAKKIDVIYQNLAQNFHLNIKTHCLVNGQIQSSPMYPFKIMFLYSLIWDNAHKKWGKLVKKIPSIMIIGKNKHLIKGSKGSQKESTMIEVNIDVKTTDDYLLHLFCGFCQNATIKFVRLLMPSTSRSAKFGRRWREIVTQEVQTNDLKINWFQTALEET